MRYKIYHPQPCWEVPYVEKYQVVPCNLKESTMFGYYKRLVHTRIGVWARKEPFSIVFTQWEVKEEQVKECYFE